MKRLLIPIVLLALILAGATSKLTAQKAAAKSAQGRLNQTMQQIAAIKGELAALQGTLDSRKSETDVRRVFLTKWGEAYTSAHKNIDNRVRKLVGTRGVEIVGVDQADAVLPLGEQQIKVRQYTRQFQGGYSNILRFLGDFETSLELASVERVTFTKSMQQDLQMSLIFAIPNLTFDAIAAK